MHSLYKPQFIVTNLILPVIPSFNTRFKHFNKVFFVENFRRDIMPYLVHITWDRIDERSVLMT